MDMGQMKRIIQELESEEGFFSRVNGICQSENIPLYEAWREVEHSREELGLNPKFSSLTAFYNARWRYHKFGGQIHRFQDEDSE
jgi:hypothetical protein